MIKTPQKPATARPAKPAKGVTESNQVFQWFAAVPPGLEGAAEAELKELGVDAKSVPGGAVFRGDMAVGASLIDHLRVPNRLLAELIEGRVFTLDELAGLIKKVPWAPLIHPLATVEVHVSTTRSRLHFSEVIQRKAEGVVKEAIRRPFVPERETRPKLKQRVSIRLIEDLATISLDAGGEMLHLRGWRRAVGEAPLRENLAAALLRMAGWTPSEPLLDPFCGSGTILIEAALMAEGRSPFVGRDFACREWPGLKNQAVKGPKWQRSVAPLLIGVDRDAKAIASARENADRAKTGIRLFHHDISETQCPAPLGLVLSNPPYGHRLEEERGYEKLGELLRGPFSGWRAMFLSPTPQLARRVSRQAFCLSTFSNGGLKVGAWAVEPGKY